MELINNYYLKSLQIFDNFDPKLSGIFFSLFIHLLILLIAIGLPNFFSQKKISLPNIIPIEIINVTETTNIDMNKNIKDNLETNEKKFIEQKKFNSSENTEIKKINLEENEKKLKQVVVEEKKVNKNIVKESMVIKEKKSPEIKIEKKNLIEDNIETIKTKKIKPKIKPKVVENKNNNNLDTLLEQKIEDKKKIDLTKKITFLFGSEASGLSNNEVSYADYTLQIPSNDKFRSLNLSHSLVIVAATVSMLISKNKINFQKSQKIQRATKKEISEMLNFCLSTLENKNFFKQRTKKPIMLENLRSIFYKMELSQKEIRILSSVFACLIKKP